MSNWLDVFFLKFIVFCILPWLTILLHVNVHRSYTPIYRFHHLKPRLNAYNISYKIIQLWCSMKCCTRLATLLYRVVSCCILLYKVWLLSNFFTKQMLYDTTFLLFARMLHDVVLVWPLYATVLYSVLLAREQQKQFSRHIPLLTGRREVKKLFSLQTSSVVFLQSSSWLCFF